MFPRKHVSLRVQVRVVFLAVMLLTIVEIINLALDRPFVVFGIVPRNVNSLWGIFTAPFIHGNVIHFVSNIFPFTVFSFLLLQHGIYRYFVVTLFVTIVGGGAVWMFGRTAMHVGASGVIFGYFSYLLLAGVLSREVKLIGISFLVGALYGGLIFGVLPIQPGVSWEGHLFGFLAGLVAAYLFGRTPRESAS